MDIMKSEFIYKLRSMINPNLRTTDFSFYISRLEEIVPISMQVLGGQFFLEKFPAYFQELQINQDDLVENLFYLPIFLKKYQNRFQISQWAIELVDYEFCCHQILKEESITKSSIYNDLSTEVYFNPIAQPLRLEFEIHEYAKSIGAKQLPKDSQPIKAKNLLFISKNPETQKLVFLTGSIYHAAIVDELQEGKAIKKGLIQNLQSKFTDVAQREWIIALKDLKSHFVIIEK